MGTDPRGRRWKDWTLRLGRASFGVALAFSPIACDGASGGETIRHDASYALADAGVAARFDGASPHTDAGAVHDASAAPADAANALPGVCPLPSPADAGVPVDAACGGRTLDSGACLVTLASGQDVPSAIALRGETVAWANTGSVFASTGSIVEVARTGGTPVTLATGVRAPVGVTLDDTNVYSAGAAIVRVPRTGGEPVMLYGDDNSELNYPVRAGNDVFFAASQYQFALLAVSTKGTGFTEIAGGGDIEIGGVSSSSTGIVFTEISDEEGVPGKLMSIRCGELPTNLLTDPSGLGLVRSAGEWVVFLAGLGSAAWPGGSYAVGTLESIPLAGGSPSLLASGIYAYDITTDGTWVYWSDANLNAIMKLNIASGAPIVLLPFDAVSVGSQPRALALDDDSLYWADPNDCSSGTCSGSIVKLTPR